MKLVTAKQHGAWAMLFIPFLLSAFAGKPAWGHILLFLAWLFLYLATYPLLMALKGKNTTFYVKWFFIYIVPAVLFLIYPLINVPQLIYFGLALIPFFLINMYFSKQKNERALANDIVAIINFGIGGLASYYYGTGNLDETAFNIFSYIFLFFLGTTFYVKTMIREKMNARYKYLSFGYHIGLVTVFMLLGKFIVALAYVSSAIRAIALYGKKLPIMQIGIIEIVNALIFFVIMLFAV